MELRGKKAAELARDSGVNKGTISLILDGQRQNTPAAIVAKLARALNVSMDYLMGITDDPEPRSLGVGPSIIELAEIAKTLPSSRQRDLLLMAKTYAEHSEASKRELLREVKDMIVKAADAAGRGAELDRYLEERIEHLLGNEEDDGDLPPGDEEDEDEDTYRGDEPL